LSTAVPDAGSDAGATRTKARPDGDHWVIDGSKAFITNSGTAITSLVTVTARTDDGIDAFIVPAGTPGLVVEPAYRKLGWHASDTHGLTLDSCRVPTDHRLGADL
jgi:butyryl-CoA dehydrogenase